MTELRKIVIAGGQHGPQLSDAQMRQLRDRFPQITFEVASSEQFHDALVDADAVLTWHLSDDDLGHAKQLKWVQTVGAGMDRFLTPEIIRRGIPITNNSGVHAPNIAEHILAMMLTFARCLPTLIHAQERHEWFNGPLPIGELAGQTLLVVGTGDIGAGLAVRAAALDMTIHGIRRHPEQPTPPAFATVAGVEQLPEMVAGADQVALCLPLTRRSEHLFDASLIGRMKPGSFIYNIGRGSLIDTDALIAALHDGRLGGAGLDVTDPEPLPSDSSLWEMPNVLITSHTSGRTPRYWERALAIFEGNIERFQRGEPLINLVDVNEGY